MSLLRKTIFVGASTLVAGMTSGCAAPGQRTGVNGAIAETRAISVSVGPCFGFCPVYDVTVGSDGLVSFEGFRHVAAVGRRQRRADPARFAAVASRLARFRPAASDLQEVCESRISDLPSVTITWRDALGGEVVRRHDQGCRSAENDALDAALSASMDELGIADWSAQKTAPGAQRG